MTKINPAFPFSDFPSESSVIFESPVTLHNPKFTDGSDGQHEKVMVCVVKRKTQSQPQVDVPFGYMAAIDHTFVGSDGSVRLSAGDWLHREFTVQELQATLDAANFGDSGQLRNPFGGLNNDGDCFDVIEISDPRISK